MNQENDLKCLVPGYEGTYFKIGQIWETRNGNTVKVVGFDHNHHTFKIVVIEEKNSDKLTYTQRGSYYEDEEDRRDLVKLSSDVYVDEFEIVKNNYKKIKSNKKDEISMIKVFNKGEPNIKNVFYQLVNKGFTEKRPFVLVMMKKEEQRIIDKIRREWFEKIAKTINGNIKLSFYIHNLKKIQDSINEAVGDSKDTKNIHLKPETVVMFYEYEKELILNNEKDFSWINKELNHYIMEKESETILFQSKKIKISVYDGYISLYELTKKRTYRTPIKYCESTNTFYI